MLFMLLGQLVLFWIEGKTSVWIGYIQNICIRDIHLYQRWSCCIFVVVVMLCLGNLAWAVDMHQVYSGEVAALHQIGQVEVSPRSGQKKVQRYMLWNIYIGSKQIQGLVKKNLLIWLVNLISCQNKSKVWRGEINWFCLNI